MALRVDDKLASPGDGTTNEVAMAVGKHVTGFVANGATLQLGIGKIPGATLAALTTRQRPACGLGMDDAHRLVVSALVL